MKEALPKDTKVSREARECVQECVTEFIAFITCESCEIIKEEKRKTIVGDDILRSMRELHFENYVQHIDYYNKKYRACLKGMNKEALDEMHNNSADMDGQQQFEYP